MRGLGGLMLAKPPDTPAAAAAAASERAAAGAATEPSRAEQPSPPPPRAPPAQGKRSLPLAVAAVAAVMIVAGATALAARASGAGRGSAEDGQEGALTTPALVCRFLVVDGVPQTGDGDHFPFATLEGCRKLFGPECHNTTGAGRWGGDEAEREGLLRCAHCEELSYPNCTVEGDGDPRTAFGVLCDEPPRGALLHCEVEEEFAEEEFAGAEPASRHARLLRSIGQADRLAAVLPLRDGHFYLPEAGLSGALAAGLSAEELQAVAGAFAQQAEGASSSVELFRKVQELSHAPPDLRARASAAALDEARHAEVCRSLARAMSGVEDEGSAAAAAAATAADSSGTSDAMEGASSSSSSPSSSPLPSSQTLSPKAANAMPSPAPAPSAHLSQLAESMARDSCVAETVDAAVAAVAASRAHFSPAGRAVLHEMAEDEAEHAALGWATLEYMIREGGPDARSAAMRALRRADGGRLFKGVGATLRGESGAGADDVPAGFGHLTRAETRGVRDAAMRRLVQPWSQALLNGQPLPLVLSSNNRSAILDEIALAVHSRASP